MPFFTHGFKKDIKHSSTGALKIPLLLWARTLVRLLLPAYAYSPKEALKWQSTFPS